MQLFVVVNGKTQAVEATESDSLYDLAKRAIEKYNRSNVGTNMPTGIDRIVLVKSGKKYSDLGQTLKQNNIVKEMTFIVGIMAPSNIQSSDPAVIPELRDYLDNMFADLGSDEFTFIGVGCYDHNHGNGSIKQQQCPDALLKFCIRQKIDLNIVLVDGGFRLFESPQIYDIDQSWVLLESQTGGKIRRYKYKKATDKAACDIWLTVFSTNVPEYGRARKGLLAGVDIAGKFEKHQTPLNAFVYGNFYTLDKDQHITLGNVHAIEGAGFKFNS